MAELVESTLSADAAYEAAGVALTFARNADFELANGVSVMVGGKVTPGPFVLSMADHIYTPTVARLVAGADMAAADLYLATDPRVTEVHDVDDATKVKSEGGKIVEIGKQIPVYDRIDCGVFAVTHELLKVLAEVRAERGDCSLTDGVRKLAARGGARVIDIGNEKWQDVDTPADRDHYEKSLRG
jgi:choline kinase